MIVRFTKPMIAALDCLFEEPFECKRDHMRWNTYLEINLRDFSKEDIERLKESVDENLSVRGMKTLSTDLKMFLSVAFDESAAKSTRMTGVKKSETVFYNRLARLERRHIYSTVGDGDENRWVAYILDSISFHPRERYCPEHLTFHLSYIQLGQERSIQFSLYPSDIFGKTVDEAFAKFGYRIENPVLRDNYLEELELYEKYVDDIGKQFWAIGVATDDVDDEFNHWRGRNEFMMEKDGIKSQVLIDVENESNKTRNKKASRGKANSSDYWKKANEFLLSQKRKADDISEEELPDEDTSIEVEFPIHPYITVFDLKKHTRLQIHVGNLEEYIYDEDIKTKLVLPDEHTRILECLMSQGKTKFNDVVRNKAGGVIILSQGPPGTGKTLTAEIYAEAMKKPLYTVQCSQLGLTLDSLETNLNLVLTRGKRWGAVTLLDEADVYVYLRGKDLHQNAVVGVFLRVLEYHTGTLFLTTNRGDLVDDAILSRCTVRIPYAVPSTENQKRIWKSIAGANGIELDNDQVDEIVDEHDDLSGRDIKNLLKLVLMIYPDPKDINSKTISEMRIFKPTTKVNETADVQH